MKKVIYISLCVFVFLALFSCRKEASTPLIGADNYVVSKKNPIKKHNTRIVSVSTQITEIICDLGCEDRLVARTDFCDYPPSIKKIQSIGGVSNPNIEKIISLKPDVVITSSMMPKKLFTQLEDAGLSVISFRESNKIEGMYKVISILGTLLERKAQADSIIKDCQQRLKKVAEISQQMQEAKQGNKPKVYYVVGYGASGDFSSGKDTYIDEIFTLAGADNIAKNSLNWTFTKEQIFKNEPDYIFIRKADVENFCNTSPYNQLKAVKNHRVIGIDGLDSQTPRTISLVEFIAKTIY
ncbi:MAG: ABC transporter substrate-binding protein [Bacteroidota bacterium]|nr:ABC transporter substrate-binding protein [Bacteroidota bacterium]